MKKKKLKKKLLRAEEEILHLKEMNERLRGERWTLVKEPDSPGAQLIKMNVEIGEAIDREYYSGSANQTEVKGIFRQAEEK